MGSYTLIKKKSKLLNEHQISRHLYFSIICILQMIFMQNKSKQITVPSTGNRTVELRSMQHGQLVVERAVVTLVVQWMVVTYALEGMLLRRHQKGQSRPWVFYLVLIIKHNKIIVTKSHSIMLKKKPQNLQCINEKLFSAQVQNRFTITQTKQQSASKRQQ